MDASFFTAPVKVPQLSGFDKSFQNLYTAQCGTLVPALFDEIIPGTIIDLEMALSASLPPLVSDTFMRCSVKVEAFFCPMRLLYQGFEHWFVGDEFEVRDPDDVSVYSPTKVLHLPHISFLDGVYNPASQDPSAQLKYSWFTAGSLADYLGLKTDGFKNGFTIDSSDDGRLNLLPWLCYHKVWSDWYRSTLIQRDCFAPLSPQDLNNQPSVANLPFYTDTFDSDSDIFDIDPLYFESPLPQGGYSLFTLADGVNLFELRQRNFGFDYFTCATPSAQNGSETKVTLDAANLADGFSIAKLRAANSLQIWKERNNITGDRYVDRLYGQYGCRPSDGIAQRSICLGSADFEVYSKGIYENDVVSNGLTRAKNPFAGTPGARFGSASAQGNTTLCKKFKAAEPGYLIVLTSLVPRVTYAMGTDPRFFRYVKNYSIGEMANPILQNIGSEPIFERELTPMFYSGETNIFGFTDRYASFKNSYDQLHGKLREDEDLKCFALQRFFADGSAPRIDSEFLEIPTDYMDNVTSVSSAISEYGVWIDTYFNYRVSMPLARYSLPSLQDPAYEHGKTLVVRRGGFRF